jgi:hypothetical protein
MAHDVFISYSSKDKPISDGICANLEAAGIRCWIAPRDIHPGEDWPKAITTAISNSKVMVLVFSASSNSSDDVSREIILAANHKLVIIPFKIEDIEPEPGKQYYLARTHWLEAMNPPTLEQIQSLVETVRSVLPIVIPEGIIQAKPVGRPPAGLPHAAMKSPSRPWYLWVIGLLVIALLGMFFWPKLQGMIASPKATVPSAGTAILQPTQTSLPTATATETLVPSATPTTGTVTGFVKWGEQPYEGVALLMCTDPVYGICKEPFYETITDAQGGYTFSGVEPGTYTIIPDAPGEELNNVHLPYWDSPEFQVGAGETVLREDMGYVKFTLNVYAPVKSADGSVTLHWGASPSNSYWCEILDYYFSEYGSCRENINTKNYSSTSVKTKPLPPGKYFYIVCDDSFGGSGESCGVGRFTIP